jgi:hypothetical protein
MFRRFRSAYFALFVVAALILLASAIVGGKPLSYYFLSSWRRMIVLWLMPPLLWFCWLGILVVRRRSRRPTAAILRLARRHRHWLMRGALFCLLLGPLARSFSAMKSAIPSMVPFYADPQLARIDEWLFLGIAPWRITHAIIGPWGTMVLDRFYVLWFPVMMGLLAWLCFTRDQKLQVRGLLAYALTCFVLGNLLAPALASVGPCFYRLFYGDAEFDQLMATLRANDATHPLFSFKEMDWLYAQKGTGTLASGISAMPSIHIAVAFLVFLIAKTQFPRQLGPVLAGAYAAIVWIGSVHLGWHYFVDGLVSVVGVWVIWYLTGRYVDRIEDSEANVSRGVAEPQLLKPRSV